MNHLTKKQITEYIAEKAQLINRSIIEYLPSHQVPDILKEAMNYSLLAGGKRIRPILAMVTYEAFQKDSKEIIPVVSNLELLHTYSLIHDDLPAMDNDDYRRGKLTNHKVYGEDIAILAGDALLTHAFGNMAKYLKELPDLDADKKLQIIEEFATYTGAGGMVGGQVLDTLGEQTKTTLENLLYIHEHKTADLLVFSIRLGALIAKANEVQLNALTNFGKKIGLAFQIQDDILDIIGDAKKIGKKIGSDESNKKVTYPYFYGVDKSKQEVNRLISSAKHDIENIGIDFRFLHDIADFLVFRES